MATETTTPPEAEFVTSSAVATAVARQRLFYGWYIVGAAFVAQFVSAGWNVYILGAFFGPMSDDLGWSRAQYISAQTVGQFAMAALGFMMGPYIDRFGSRRIMLGGAVVLAIATWAQSEVTEVWQWVLLRGVFLTVGTALIGNLAVNVTLSKWFVERRGSAISLAGMGISMSGVLLPLIATAYIDRFGWEAAWRMLAVAALALAIPAALIMRRQPEDYGLHPDGRTDEEIAAGGGEAARADFENSLTRGEAMRTTAIYLIIVAFGLSGMSMVTTIIMTIPYVEDSGFSRSTAAVMMATLALASALGKVPWGWAVDRWEARVVSALSFLFGLVGMVFVVFGARADSLPLLLVGYSLVGSGMSGQLPLQETIWATYFGRRYIGAVRSVALPFTVLFSAGGPLLVSAYYDRAGEYDGAMLGMAFAWLVAAGVIMFAHRPARLVPHDPRSA